MKIWYGYGSEHSANMVMIGHFQTIKDAQQASEAIQQISDYISRTDETHEGMDSYSDGMLELLKKLRLYVLQPYELNQFIYDIRVEPNNKEIVITTEESDFSAFLKILLEHKAKVEIYSAHFYPNTGKGR